jgi:hypothetical protein
MNHLYKNRVEANEAAKKLGCSGSHIQRNEGKKRYSPCTTEKKYKEVLENDNEENKEELEELIDFDGTMLNSKVPILDPLSTSAGFTTMDKRVAAGHQTQDPLMRGYRVYYGESIVREEDMSDAFGYDETQDMDAKKTIDYFVKELDFDKDEAKERALEMGKEEKLDKTSEFKNLKNFIGKLRLTEKEFTKEEIVKMAEDILVDKKQSSELKEKDNYTEVSPILKNNIKALKNMASANGLSVNDLVKMLKNE